MRGIGSERGDSKGLVPRGWRDAILPARSFSFESTRAPDLMTQDLQRRIDDERRLRSTWGLVVDVTVAPLERGSFIYVQVYLTPTARFVSLLWTWIGAFVGATLLTNGLWVGLLFVPVWCLVALALMGQWARLGRKVEHVLRDFVTDISEQIDQVGPYRS